MSFNWQALDPETLERHFNPRVAIGNAEAEGEIAAYVEASAAARAAIGGEYDIRYGDGEKATLDLHRPGRADGPLPLLFFIHGGYWRALDKSDHSFMARPYVEAGVAVANVNYDLCPTVTLNQIVAQVREAFAFVHAHAGEWGCDPARIHVAGHSAGAHLTGMILAHDWKLAGLPERPVLSAAPISGIFDPAPVMRISVNAEVRLDEATARANDCMQHPPSAPVPVLLAVGADEPAGWLDQTSRYETTCRKAGCEVQTLTVEGTNHFTVLRDAAEPQGQIFTELLRRIEHLR